MSQSKNNKKNLKLVKKSIVATMIVAGITGGLNTIDANASSFRGCLSGIRLSLSGLAHTAGSYISSFSSSLTSCFRRANTTTTTTSSNTNGNNTVRVSTTNSTGSNNSGEKCEVVVLGERANITINGKKFTLGNAVIYGTSEKPISSISTSGEISITYTPVPKPRTKPTVLQTNLNSSQTNNTEKVTKF